MCENLCNNSTLNGQENLLTSSVVQFSLLTGFVANANDVTAK